MTDNVVYILFLVGLSAGIIGYVSSRSHPAAVRRAAKALLLTAVVLNSGYLIVMLLMWFHPNEGLGNLARTSVHKVLIFFGDGAIVGFVIAKYTGATILTRPKHANTKALGIEDFHKHMRLVMTSYFLGTSIGKIPFHQPMLRFFELSGYGNKFLWLITFMEGIGAIGLLFRHMTVYAALILMSVMVGAVYTHYHNYFSQGLAEPFSNSLDGLKMMPFLITILIGSLREQYSMVRKPA